MLARQDSVPLIIKIFRAVSPVKYPPACQQGMTVVGLSSRSPSYEDRLIEEHQGLGYTLVTVSANIWSRKDVLPLNYEDDT